MNKTIRQEITKYQLCYVSQAKSPSETRLQDLRDILSEARDFNVKLKVKGGIVLCRWLLLPMFGRRTRFGFKLVE